MEELQQSLQSIIEDTPQKLVLSKPTSQNPYKKTEVCKRQSGWQCSNYTQTQVFHQNISEQELFSHLCQLMEQYRQLNAWTACSRWDVMISKKARSPPNATRNLPSWKPIPNTTEPSNI